MAIQYSHKTVMHGVQQRSHKTTQHGSTTTIDGIERCNECGAEVNTDMAVFITRHGGTYIYSCGVCGNVIKHEYEIEEVNVEP